MALCLQNVYAVGSGNRQLFEVADASRSLLINSSRSMGLFSSSSAVRTQNLTTTSSASDDPYLPVNGILDDEKLQERWLAWRDDEADKRLAWCIFEYDCSISTLSNRRGNIAFNDMCVRMPVSLVLRFLLFDSYSPSD